MSSRPRDRPDRRRRCASRPDRSRRSNRTGGRPPPKCTYLNFSVRTTARLHWRELMPKCFSALRLAIERKSNSQCAASRQPAGVLAVEKRRQRASVEMGGGIAAEQIERGRQDVDGFGESVDLAAGRLASAGVADDQRDVVAAVEEAALAEHAMVAHHLGMVRGEDDDRVVPVAMLLHGVPRAGRAAHRPRRSCRNRSRGSGGSRRRRRSRPCPWRRPRNCRCASRGRVVVDVRMDLALGLLVARPAGRLGRHPGRTSCCRAPAR